MFIHTVELNRQQSCVSPLGGIKQTLLSYRNWPFLLAMSKTPLTFSCDLLWNVTLLWLLSLCSHPAVLTFPLAVRICPPQRLSSTPQLQNWLHLPRNHYLTPSQIVATHWMLDLESWSGWKALWPQRTWSALCRNLRVPASFFKWAFSGFSDHALHFVFLAHARPYSGCWLKFCKNHGWSFPLQSSVSFRA